MLLCLTCLKKGYKERSPFRQRGVCTSCKKPTSKGFFFADSANNTPFKYSFRTQTQTTQETQYRCPECGEEITHLCYNQQVTEYGRYYFESEEHESNNSENDGDAHYTCPECGEDVEKRDCLAEV